LTATIGLAVKVEHGGLGQHGAGYGIEAPGVGGRSKCRKDMAGGPRREVVGSVFSSFSSSIFTLFLFAFV